MKTIKLLLAAIVFCLSTSAVFASTTHSKQEKIRVIFSNNLFGQITSCG